MEIRGARQNNLKGFDLDLPLKVAALASVTEAEAWRLINLAGQHKLAKQYTVVSPLLVHS